jgi:hypothetical protein
MDDPWSLKSLAKIALMKIAFSFYRALSVAGLGEAIIQETQ